jgi:hypothetical protein
MGARSELIRALKVRETIYDLLECTCYVLVDRSKLIESRKYEGEVRQGTNKPVWEPMVSTGDDRLSPGYTQGG